MDREKIKEFLADAVRQIKTAEDPKELNEYRKIFRENVPFSLRSYFGAYMLKAAIEGGARERRSPPSRERYSYSERNSEKRWRQGDAPHGPRTPIPVLSEDEASSVFLSIGRKRKVFPKDIIYLIMQNAEIERAHIGEIKILDNYSFVQVVTADAQKVIDALSGIEYRGKRLTASFARTAPHSGGDASLDSADEGGEADESLIEAEEASGYEGE